MKVSVFVLLVAAVLIMAECVPLEQAVSLDKSDADGVHEVQRRSDRAQTLDDALNIPIAALEAVRRLLTNRFGGKNPDSEAKSD